jgi:catechol 2,3-dioxygenase-like lactoylglutathione lyase family enzyme
LTDFRAPQSVAILKEGRKPMIKHRGLRHLALNVKDVARAVNFYQRVFGMAVMWQPDADNAYLSSGCDNLALHRGAAGNRSEQSLDHLGFIVPTIEDLETGYQWAQTNQLDIARPLRRHRDGSVSYYVRDPDGNVIQILYEPSISPLTIYDGAVTEK